MEDLVKTILCSMSSVKKPQSKIMVTLLLGFCFYQGCIFARRCSPSMRTGVHLRANMQYEQQTQHALQREAFERLEDVPPEIEWFGNIQNKHTKRAYLCVYRSWVWVGPC